MKQQNKMTPEVFKTLPVEQKRVEVAKDVIGQILAQKYLPHTGVYVDNIEIVGKEDEWAINVKEEIEDWDIRDTFEKIKSCQVCAMGACILSITKFENQLKFSDIGSERDTFSEKTDILISSIFTPNQLSVMEIMFEGSWKPGQIHNYAADRMLAQPTKEQINAAQQFYEDNRIDDEDEDEDAEQSAEERLIGIMQNIIDNEGELVLNGKAVI